MNRRLVRRRALIALRTAGVVALLGACGSKERDTHEHPQTVDREERAPENFLPSNLDSRRDSVLLRNATRTFDTDDSSQPDTLPTLPTDVTLAQIREGDSLFHARGGCVNCHGSEAQGLAARGSSLTAGLHSIPSSDLRGIDSIIVNGIPDAETRSPIAMPPRGQKSNLTVVETHDLAAYVWALANARGEPWAGGHPLHAPHDMNASARTAIP
ncbi:MAG: cytochrome c [Gemmatimonadota bacterium]|nr:cytochrome c [Gemmatimonadota bacterium]